VASKKLAVDYMYIDKSEIEETGEFDHIFLLLAVCKDSLNYYCPDFPVGSLFAIPE
jgi:hypothetical protein